MYAIGNVSLFIFLLLYWVLWQIFAETEEKKRLSLHQCSYLTNMNTLKVHIHTTKDIVYHVYYGLVAQYAMWILVSFFLLCLIFSLFFVVDLNWKQIELQNIIPAIPILVQRECNYGRDWDIIMRGGGEM